jgi:hypothetical protein
MSTAKVNWYQEDVNRDTAARLELVLDLAIIRAQAFAKSLIRKTNPKPHKTPSAPGEAPAIITSFYKGSIRYEKPRPLVRRLGSTLQPLSGAASRALYLELGTSKMAPRPVFRPALVELEARIIPAAIAVIGKRKS